MSFLFRKLFFSASGRVRTAGFTLLELMVVLALAALILAAVPVYFANSMPSARLGASAREIASTVRYARAAALSKGREEVFTLNLRERTFGISGKGQKRLPEGIEMKVTDPVYGDVQDEVFSLRFGPRGSVEGAEIVLMSEKKYVIVKVDPVSGASVIRE